MKKAKVSRPEREPFYGTMKNRTPGFDVDLFENLEHGLGVILSANREGTFLFKEDCRRLAVWLEKAASYLESMGK